MKHRGRPLIIDIEATGFAARSYAIEVGVAPQDGRKCCSLILPAPQCAST